MPNPRRPTWAGGGEQEPISEPEDVGGPPAVSRASPQRLGKPDTGGLSGALPNRHRWAVRCPTAREETWGCLPRLRDHWGLCLDSSYTVPFLLFDSSEVQ